VGSPVGAGGRAEPRVGPDPRFGLGKMVALNRSGLVNAVVSRLWIKCRLDRTWRSRVRNTRENLRFSKWKKVMDDFSTGSQGERTGL